MNSVSRNEMQTGAAQKQDRTTAIGEIHPEEQMIVDRIFSAVMEQRLAPRTKLREATLCETFGVGRMRVRRALLLLGSQGIVELHSNRGAYVACPSPEEAREVFEARRVIESGIVRELAKEFTDQGVAVLRDHVALEDAARRDGERTELIRLSGEFHVELARCHGNAVLNRLVRELVTRSSLIVALFGVSRVSSCPEDEHSRILEAIVSHDADAAAQAIRAHLGHIQDALDLEKSQTVTSDLTRILGTG